MRVCFQLQVKPERLADYRQRHATVWPEMVAALADAGWHNYSLFVRPDGLLIGYVETADGRSLESLQRAMAATEVNERWQAEMAEYFSDLQGQAPDEGFAVLDEIFHLEDQLTTVGAPVAEEEETR